MNQAKTATTSTAMPSNLSRVLKAAAKIKASVMHQPFYQGHYRTFQPRAIGFKHPLGPKHMGPDGFEPSTSPLSAVCSTN